MSPAIYLWKGQVVVSFQIYLEAIKTRLNKLKNYNYVVQRHYKCRVFEF